MEAKLYRIYNPRLDKFSKGGMWKYDDLHSWTKRGKTWSGIGYVKSHITMLKNAHFVSFDKATRVTTYKPDRLYDMYINDNCELWVYSSTGIEKSLIKDLV